MATREEIEARYAEWEIVGAAEIRQVDPEARDFTPHKPPTDAGLRRSSERPPELESAIDAAEAFCSRVPSALRHLLRQARQVGGDKRGRAAFRSGTSDNCIGNDKPRRSGACAGAELFNASILVFPA